MLAPAAVAGFAVGFLVLGRKRRAKCLPELSVLEAEPCASEL